MAKERTWLLLSLQFSGEATAEELEELATLLREHPELNLQAEVLKNLWQNKQANLTGNKAAAYDKHLQRLSNHLSAPALQFETPATEETEEDTAIVQSFPKRRLFWIAAGIAASALVVFLGVSMFNAKQAVAGKQVSNTISTRAGSKSKVQLPDGTQVWLNADSRLTYGQSFSGPLREVQLTGEAYFDVVRDKTRPFIIHTSSIDVKVLGTAFNVRSYPGEKTTETALIRGSVEVILHNNPEKKIVLKPNEKLVVENKEPARVAEEGAPPPLEPTLMITKGKVRVDKKDETSVIETMWVENKLAFDNDSLSAIALAMEHWYNIKMVIKNDKLKSVPFTGIFENKTIPEVLEALSLSRHFRYDIKDGVVSIW